jgi:hypothetical protein
VKVIITVDVEADGAWTRSERVTVENLRALPRFQSMCDRFGMKPTYLCTYETVRADSFAPVAAWQKAGRCEVGTHLHPWTTPPFNRKDATDIDTSEYPSYPSELSPERFREKMKVLGDAIASRTGDRPTSYRAGRWGFSKEQIAVLLELGYVVDCSVTPLIDRSNHKGLRDGGPDFRKAPVTPYWLSDDDICAPGRSRLLEVPVTIVQTNDVLRASPTARWAWSKLQGERGAGLLNRAMTLNPLWLRPYSHMSARKLRLVYRTAQKLELPVVEMMLHSSELLAGASPSFPDRASIERVYAMLEGILETMHAEGCMGVTLTDFAREHAASVGQA